jgi:hypothetical protein
MNATLFFSLAAIGLILVAPIVSPLVVWHLSKKQGVAVARVLVRQHLLLSGIIILIFGLGLSSISFHAKIGNIAATVLACICYLSLVFLSFRVQPKIVGYSVGIAASIVGTVACLLGAFFYSVDDNLQYTYTVGSNLRCDVSYFGWGGSASGTTVKLFKNHFGIDRQVDIASFIDGQDTPPFATNQEACIYMLGKYHG